MRRERIRQGSWLLLFLVISVGGDLYAWEPPRSSPCGAAMPNSRVFVFHVTETRELDRQNNEVRGEAVGKIVRCLNGTACKGVARLKLTYVITPQIDDPVMPVDFLAGRDYLVMLRPKAKFSDSFSSSIIRGVDYAFLFGDGFESKKTTAKYAVSSVYTPLAPPSYIQINGDRLICR